MCYQTIRRPIVIANATLFHLFLVFHLLFSPVIIVVAAHHGIVNASFIALALILLTSIFFGRAYCAWFCPGCGVQELAALLVKKKAKLNPGIYIKYAIFIIWMGVIIMGYFLHGIQLVDVKFGMSNITLARKLTLTMGAAAIILPLALLCGQFASCKYVCWLAPLLIFGTWLRDRLHIPGLRLKADPGKCSGCKLCTTNCPMAIDVMSNVRNQAMRHAECILCGNCIDSCRQGVIKFTLGGLKKRD